MAASMRTISIPIGWLGWGRNSFPQLLFLGPPNHFFEHVDFRSVDKKTLDLLQSYEWPGNIRELQNVIERSVILSSREALSVDEMWLPKETSRPASRVEASPRLNGDAVPRGERETIEAALAETRSRVSGPSGAAAKLGIPPSTLDHRIKALNIHKEQFH